MSTRKFLQYWHTFWHRRVPPHALALSRIAFAVFLLVYWCTFAVDVPMLFANTGVVLPYFTSRIPDSLQWLLTPPSESLAYILFLYTTVCIVLFGLGALYRFALINLLLLAWYYWQLQLHLFINSYSRIIFVVLIVFAISNAHYTFSYYAKRRLGSFGAWKPISILPQRLITVQMTATYFAVSWQKITLVAWSSGEVLTYTLMNMWSTPQSRFIAALPIPLTIWDYLLKLFTYWEMFTPFGLWIRTTRLFTVCTLIAFHLCIAVFISIWWFVFLFSFYHLFWSPESVHTWCCSKHLTTKKSAV